MASGSDYHVPEFGWFRIVISIPEDERKKAIGILDNYLIAAKIEKLWSTFKKNERKNCLEFLAHEFLEIYIITLTWQIFIDIPDDKRKKLIQLLDTYMNFLDRIVKLPYSCYIFLISLSCYKYFLWSRYHVICSWSILLVGEQLYRTLRLYRSTALQKNTEALRSSKAL